jgi:hypothetical protein
MRMIAYMRIIVVTRITLFNVYHGIVGTVGHQGLYLRIVQ